MKVSKVTNQDGLHLAKIITLLQFAKQIKAGLASAKIEIEGPAFEDEMASLTWLHNLSKDVATHLSPKPKATKVKPKTPKKKAKK